MTARGGILWGRHPAHGGGWLKLSNYSKGAEEARKADGWTVQRRERGEWPTCDCGSAATCGTFSLVENFTRYECRPCQQAREARTCGHCDGRGKWRDGTTICATCAGSGLNPNREVLA